MDLTRVFKQTKKKIIFVEIFVCYGRTKTVDMYAQCVFVSRRQYTYYEFENGTRAPHKTDKTDASVTLLWVK